MNPGITIFGFTIYYYGIIIMVGVLAATFMGTWLAKKRGLDPEILWDALIWVLVAGIIGARLWHILTPPPTMVAAGMDTWFYLTHPLDAINLRNGGLGIVGAVFGGALGLYIYLRRKRQSFLAWVDVIVPGLVLAQAIGRWGNYFNQELYGGPSDLPWAIFIDPQHRLPGFENVAYYHPTFLYESLWNLLNMAILLWIGFRFAGKLKRGDIFFSYLILYPVTRFVMEILRLNSSTLFAINANQWLMVVVALVAAGMLYWNHRPGSGPEEPLAVDSKPASKETDAEEVLSPDKSASYSETLDLEEDERPQKDPDNATPPDSKPESDSEEN